MQCITKNTDGYKIYSPDYSVGQTPRQWGGRRHGAFMGCHGLTRKGVTMKTIVCLLLTALLVIFTFTPTTFAQDYTK